MPIERLKFEHEKRQREVSDLRRDLADARRELDELYEWYEEDRTRHPGAYNDAGSEPSGLHDIPRQMDGLEARIRQLQEEMSTIQIAIDGVWT